MRTIKDIRTLLAALSDVRGKTVGLVPTMGYFHDGHLSLMKAAQKECEVVVVSVFVNPLQFGPQEDFETYPRDPDRDARLAQQAGADILFMPEKDEMYPESPLTKVSVSRVTEGMCGRRRPGHFDGVATVVAKLFNLVRPDKAYFGLKDAQQVAVIKRMTADLNMPVTVVSCPTVREADGLAMSSRNVYLNPEERKQATVLYRALKMAEKEILAGNVHTSEEVERRVQETIEEQPLAEVEYVEMRTYPELNRVTRVNGGTYIVAVAVRFGQTRLIDNVIIHKKDTRYKQ